MTSDYALSESGAVICSYLDVLQWPAYTDLRYDSVPLKTVNYTTGNHTVIAVLKIEVN